MQKDFNNTKIEAMVTQSVWRSKAASILNAIILITLASVAKQILDYISSLNDVGTFLDILDGQSASFAPDQWDIMGYFATLLIVIGYFMYLSSLRAFSVLQIGEAQVGVLKIRSGIAWSLVAVFVDYIPLIGGIFSFIFNIVAFFVMLGGYGRLRSSSNFPLKARSGAATLYSSMIVGLIGTLLGLIPIMGAIFGGIFSLIAFIMLLCGWVTIKNTVLQPTDAVVLGQPSEGNAPKQVTVPAATAQAAVDPGLRTKLTAKSDADLNYILENPEEYNASFVQAARQEKDNRETYRQAESARAKMAEKSDDELVRILANREEYNDIFISAAKEEQKTRRARKDAEEKLRMEEKARAEAELKYTPGNTVQPTEEATPVTAPTAPASPSAPSIQKAETPAPANPPASATVVPPAPRKSSAGLIAGIIIAVLLVGGICSYIFWYRPYAKDRDALRTYVYATNLFLRSSKLAGVEYNIITKIPYGSELITYQKDSEWADIKFNGMKGYVASPFVLEKSDFDLLNNVWGNTDARECIISTKCRNAILDFLKRNQLQSGSHGWQIFTKGKDEKPNAVYYPRLYDKNSKYTDFAFLIRDNISGGRKLVIYSFGDESELPVLRASITGIPAEGYLEYMGTNRYGKIIVNFSGGQNFVLNK